MKKYLLLIVAGLFSMATFAHNPNASTTVLVEKENDVWVVQISASLTAFQQEIKTHFSVTPYETPDEFREMVLQHIKNNLHLNFNGTDHVTLVKGMVQLGHETKVVFEVLGIPSDIQTVRIKNTAFKDIHKSQSALFLFKEGFTKDKFVLNSTNDYSLALEVNGDKFVEITENKASLFANGMLLIVLGAGAVIFLAIRSCTYKKARPIGIDIQ